MIFHESADAAGVRVWAADRSIGFAPADGAPREWRYSPMTKGQGAAKSDLYGSVREPVCGRLRALFGDVAQEEMPDQLADLADRLQAALERGELFGTKATRSSP